MSIPPPPPASSSSLGSVFLCLAYYGYRSRSRTRYGMRQFKRGNPFRGHFDSLHAQPFSEFFRTKVMEETETHTSMIQACDSDSTRNRLASIVIGVILKLEINHHFITHNTVECSPRHAACSNQTQRNKQSCSNRKSERRNGVVSACLKKINRSVIFIASGNNINNTAPLGAGELIN